MKKGIGVSFEQDISINRFKLEQECENHSNIYCYYSQLASDARSARDQQKARLKFLEGKKELDYRANPIGDIKVSEKSITAMVAVDEDLEKERRLLIEAENVLFVHESALTNLEHRKRMLDNLVQLYIKGYFARPGNHSSSLAGDEISKEARKNLKKERNDGKKEE